MDSSKNNEISHKVNGMVRQINHLLQEIQNITKNEIFQDQLNEKIKLPPIGKIRRKEELKEKFKLNLLSDRILADNIAYAIQYVDLLSYLYEMTELGGKKSLSVGAIFRNLCHYCCCKRY